LLPGLLEASPVGFQVSKLQRVGRFQLAVDALKARLQEVLDAGASAEPLVPAALRTHLQVGLEVRLPDGLAAALALDPQALRAHPVGSRLNYVVFPPEPGHPRSQPSVTSLTGESRYPVAGRRCPKPSDRSKSCRLS